MRVTKRFTFEAAHRLPNYKGACHNLHGHSYVLEISVDGEVDKETGMVVDFSVLKKTVGDVILLLLDHAYINEIMELPTAENMVNWIYNRLSSFFNVTHIRLFETEDSWVDFYPKGD